MSEILIPNEANEPGAGMAMPERLTRKLVIRRLSGITVGTVLIREANGDSQIRLGDPASTLKATIEVLDPKFFTEIALGGAVGGAESYIRGDWSCDDLTCLVRILVLNRGVLEGMESGIARLATPFRRILHWLNRNTRSGSRKNISAHYDLGNDFFRLWLDKKMMYSSAVFENDQMTLEEASEAKLERICRKLELGPGDHVLEIGTGWGAFAVYAAKHFGCRVTSTTISVEQYERACRRVEQAGVSDKVTLLLKDYRDLDGRYDKLVSIEMIEAVGNRFMPEFFRKCRSLLKPHGQMCLQSITIADQRYKAALRSVDFIQRYIFPGGFLPSLTALASSITENTDMRVSHVEDFGVHYGRTLEEWRNRFASRLPEIRRLGYSEEFLRMWHYYLCYCEGAFRERAIGVVQLVVEGPLVRREPLLGAINNRA